MQTAPETVQREWRIPDALWERSAPLRLPQQRRVKDPEARKQLIFDMQRYAAQQQYYVYLSSAVVTSSWQPYVKNFAPNLNADFGSRVAALGLER